MHPQSSMGLGETYLQAQECGQSYVLYICWSQGHAGAHVEKTRRTIIRSRFRPIIAHAEQKQIKLRWTGYFAKVQKPTVVGTANGEVQTNEEVKYTFTILISSWQSNYSKKRLLPRVDQRSKNHGCPKKGRQLYAKRTISYLLLFQGYQPVLGAIRRQHRHRKICLQQVQLKSRSDGLAPGKWCRPNINNKPKLKEGWQSRFGWPFARSSWMDGGGRR